MQETDTGTGLRECSEQEAARASIPIVHDWEEHRPWNHQLVSRPDPAVLPKAPWVSWFPFLALVSLFQNEKVGPYRPQISFHLSYVVILGLCIVPNNEKNIEF